MRVEHGHTLMTAAFLCCLWFSQPSLADIASTGAGAASLPPSVTWHRVADAPCPPRQTAAVAVFQDKLWIMGGEDNNDHTLSDIWNSADGAHWTQVVQQAPWPENDGNTAVFDNRLWLLECRNEDGTWGASWSSSDGITWLKATSNAPWQTDSGRSSYAVAVFQDNLWVMGGRRAGVYYDDVWSSPDGINWTCRVQHAPWFPRCAFAAAVFDNKLWVMGGDEYSDQFGDVWYTTDGVAWVNESPKAWHERAGHSAASFENALWVFGGGYISGSGIGSHNFLLDEVQCSTDGRNWVQSFLPPSSGGVPSGICKGKLWFMGFSLYSIHIESMSPVTLSISRGRAPLSRVGAPLTLSLTATGFPDSIACQWTKDGEAIANATTDTYHLDQVTLSDAGLYTCQVTDENGVVFTADPVPVAVSAEKVPAAGPVGLALGVCLAASVLVLRQRKFPHRSR